MDEEKKEEGVEESEEQTETSPSTGEGGNKKTLLTIVVVAILVIGALELTGTTSIFSGGQVLATVNGEKVTQQEFDDRMNQILNSPQAATLNLDDPTVRAQIEEQILTEIINTRLLLQNASAEGITATDEEVQGEYDLIVERLGSAEQLAEELTRGGLTDREFRDNIRDQIIIQKYLEGSIDETLLTATDEEIEAFYETISEQPGVPALEDIRLQIESQIISEKQLTAINNVVINIRAEATIETFEE